MNFFIGCKNFEDVQAKYRSLLKKYHPDLNKNGLETTKQIILEYKKISENKNQTYPIGASFRPSYTFADVATPEAFAEWLRKYASNINWNAKEEPIDWSKYYSERPDEYEWSEKYKRWFPVIKRSYGKKFRGKLPMDERIRRWVKDMQSLKYKPNWVFYQYKKFCYEKNLPIQLSEVQYIGEQIGASENTIKWMYNELIKEDLAKSIKKG